MIDQGEVYVAEGNLMKNGFACDYKVNDDFFRGVGSYILIKEDLLGSAIGSEAKG